MPGLEPIIQEAQALEAAGRWPEASELYSRALQGDPSNPRIQCNAAIALAHCGSLRPAAALLGRCVEANPAFAEALHALGRVQLALGSFGEAAHTLERAGQLPQPTPDVFYELATALQGCGNLPAAADAYRKAIALRPSYAEAHNNLGSLLKATGDLRGAEAEYRQAASAAPGQPLTWYNLGLTLQTQGRLEEAVDAYRRSLEAKPYQPDAENNLGLALRELQRIDEAVAAFRRAIALDPASVRTWVNLGAALERANDARGAIEALNRALELEPSDPRALCNLGNAYTALNMYPQGVRAYERALQLNPALHEAAYNIALAQLVSGDLRRGFAGYEARMLYPRYRERYAFKGPRWDGVQGLEGRTLLLYAEQGFGDTIQFLRYVPLACQRAGRVVLRVQPALRSLVLARFPQVEVQTPYDPVPDHDAQCSLLSLPRVFGTDLDTIPGQVPYLEADARKVAALRGVLSREGSLKVGIAWSGNARHRNDHNRSVPLAPFLRALETADADLFVVQRDVRAGDAEALRDAPRVTDLSGHLRDFTDTAAVVSLLDLVVTVDTSVAHLAGALGARTWVLLPFAPDWRWLLGRTDSPWYPTARLFRQTRVGDWSDALGSLSGALSQWAPAAARGGLRPVPG